MASPDMSALSQPAQGAQPSAPTPTAPVAGPHSRLLAMIQGLAVGVGAFAKSAATQGREGGPQDVIAYQQKQQEISSQQQADVRANQAEVRAQSEGDLRMQTMRANMAMNQFAFEQSRLRAPLELQKEYNEIALQKNTALQEFSKATGVPLMSLAYMAGDDTGKVMGAMTDVAKQNGTSVHDIDWAHTQNDGKPGTGGNVVGLDIAKNSHISIPAELAPTMMLPVQHSIDMAAATLGADAPVIKGAQQMYDKLEQAVKTGTMPIGQYAILSNSIAAQVTTKADTQKATIVAQKEQSEATEAANKATITGRQANPVTAAADAGLKAGAEAKARQPYEVALKKMEAPIAEGVASNKEAREKVDTYAKAYVDKLQGANELLSSLDQAEAGNSAASKAAIFKMAGMALPAGGKRGFSEAVSNMEKQGNIPQQWVSKIKDAVTGDRWTAEMSQDMRDFAKAQADVAAETLRANVRIMNVNHKTNVDPEALINAAGHLSSAAPAPAGSLAEKWSKALTKSVSPESAK